MNDCIREVYATILDRKEHRRKIPTPGIYLIRESTRSSKRWERNALKF